MFRSGKPQRGLVRQLVEFGLLVGMGVLVCRTWLVEPYVVPSGSMALTLLGPHRVVACGDCGYRFRTEAGPEETARGEYGRTLRCPNCGFAGNEASEAPAAGGDRFLVDRSVYWMREPRRWEVVVFRAPHDNGRTWIKRVVGLPGERVQVRGGDVYIDGALLRKSLAEQRAMAVTVHDDAFRPSREPAPPPRWRGEGGWTRLGSGYAFEPGGVERGTSEEGNGIEWLVYRHWRRSGEEAAGVREEAIMDDVGYNRFSSRQLNVATDLGLCCVVSTSGEGVLALAASNGRERFEVRLDPARRVTRLVGAEGETIKQAGFAADLGAAATRLELWLADRQVLLGVAGEEVLRHAYEAGEGGVEPTSRPFAVGCRDLGVRVRELRVARDVYYTEPFDANWALEEPVALADDEYFVLGDNSPVSLDSRRWRTGPGIGRDLIVGRAWVVHHPSRVSTVWGRQFQVPDWGRIRYIR